MLELSDHELDTVRSYLDHLVGLHLMEMWRYPGFQVFDFDLKVRSNDQSSWSLGVGCDWRIAGPDYFSLGSWNFGAKGKRCDYHGRWFYEYLGQAPPLVEQTHVDPLGGLYIVLSEGFSLGINPSVRFGNDDDQWRIFRGGSGKPEQLILEGGQLYLWEDESEPSGEDVRR